MKEVESPTPMANLVKAFSKVASGFVVVAAALVLAGRALDLTSLESSFTGMAPMNPVTALTFIVAGVCLWLRQQGPGDSALRMHRQPATWLALAVVLIGLARVVCYALCWDAGFDQFLFRGKVAPGGGPPQSEMAPNSGLNFALCGLALLFLDGKTRRGMWPAQPLVLLAALISLLALIAHAYNLLALEDAHTHIPMPLSSAALFEVLALGILCARPKRGLMEVLISDSTGGAVARRLLPAAILIPLILGALRLTGQRMGLYRTEFGVALFAVATVVVFTLLIWWNAQLLHRAHRERRRMEYRLAVQHTVTRVLAESPTLADAIPQILQSICQGLRWPFGAMWEVDGTAEKIRCAEVWHEPGNELAEFEEVTRGFSFESGVGLPGRVWAEGQPVWIPDVAQETSFPRAPHAAKARLHGAFGFPVRLDDEVLGVMEFFSASIQQPDEQLLDLLGAVGLQLGQFIDRKRAEEKLRESEQRLQSILDNTTAVIYVKDTRGRYLLVNRRFERLFHVSRTEIPGKSDYDFFAREIADEFRANDVKVLSSQAPLEFEEVVFQDDGMHTYLSIKFPLVNRNGVTHAVCGVSTDITQRKQAEAAVREAEQRFRMLLQSTMEGVYGIDLQGRCIFINQSAARMIGRAPEEVIGRNMHDVLHHSRPDGTPYPVDQCPIFRAFRKGEGCRVDTEVFWRRDGTSFPVEYSSSPVRGGDGKIAGAVVTFNDITVRKRAEEALRKSESRFRHVWEDSLDGMRLTDADGTTVLVNGAFCRMVDKTSEEMTGRPFTGAYSPDRAQETLATYQRRFAERRIEPHFEREMTLWNGRQRWFEFSNTFLEIEGEPPHLLSIVRDISARKRAEAQLRQASEELARSNRDLETFASAASHDLHEPLRMVGSYTQLLAQRYQGKLDSQADEFIGYAVNGTRRMQLLINDLLAYARVGTHGKPPAPTDAEQVLSAALDNLKLAIEENAAGVTHDPLPTVQADDVQLTQLFQNLIGNAIKFRSDQSPRIHVGVERRNQEWLFHVRDNGIGIEPKFFEQIFAIFQRLHTSEEYPGTGIGLAMCKKIVERHGGRIWVESAPGRGSTFYFTLPVSRELEE